MCFLTRFLLLILITAAGFLLGAAILWARINGVFVTWQALPALPAPVRQLAGARVNQVYVETTQGVFLCQTNARDDACWKATSWPVEQDLFMACGETELAAMRSLPVMPLLHREVARMDAAVCMRDVRWYEVYSLADDGRVWYWGFEQDDRAGWDMLVNGVCISSWLFFVLGLAFLTRKKANEGKFF